MLCIRSLPGESANSARAVTAPYSTAQAAHTRATTTPWWLRKLLKEAPHHDVCTSIRTARQNRKAGQIDTSARHVTDGAKSIARRGAQAFS
jgi:hypothetical protein